MTLLRRSTAVFVALMLLLLPVVSIGCGSPAAEEEPEETQPVEPSEEPEEEEEEPEDEQPGYDQSMAEPDPH